MKKFVSNSPAQTRNIAAKIVSQTSENECFALVGNLGSGKTEFTKGTAKYLGVKNNITSPTFVLLKPYDTKDPVIKKLVHIDCYRLSHPDELKEIGLEEFLLDPHTLVIIEWADKIKSILPKDTIWIHFETGKDPKERVIEIK